MASTKSQNNPPPLPTGEYPWANDLRRARKAISRVKLLSILILVAYLIAKKGPEAWAEMTFQMSAYSRRAETRADVFAVSATKNASAGLRAFKKLGYQNIGVFRPPFWEELFFNTHPSLEKRIQRLESKI